jgi:hypothetical protein
VSEYRAPEFRKPSAVSRKLLALAPAMESEPSALTDTARMVSVPDKPCNLMGGDTWQGT